LSRNISVYDGNDTIDPYPLPYEGKLTKLLCISKERFEKLALAAQEFLTKKHVFKNTPSRTQRIKLLCKAPAPSSRNIERTVYPEYTPTRIWQTRQSEFWQWQRVSEWHREYGQDEILNEKRHILV
jgi:hypothetical protein